MVREDYHLPEGLARYFPIDPVVRPIRLAWPARRATVCPTGKESKMPETKTAAEDEAGQDHKPKKTRSPNYPVVPLEEAVHRVRTVYDRESLHFAPVKVVVTK